MVVTQRDWASAAEAAWSAAKWSAGWSPHLPDV